MLKWRAWFVRQGVGLDRVKRSVKNRVWKYAARNGISPDEMWDHVQEWGFSDFESVDDAIEAYAVQGDVPARMLRTERNGPGGVKDAMAQYEEARAKYEKDRAKVIRLQKMDVKRAGHEYVFRLSPNEEDRFLELVRKARLNRSEYIRRAIFGVRPRIWDPAKLMVDWWTPEERYDRPEGGRAPSDRSPQRDALRDA